jgi:hypothetical protein
MRLVSKPQLILQYKKIDLIQLFRILLIIGSPT